MLWFKKLCFRQMIVCAPKADTTTTPIHPEGFTEVSLYLVI